MTVRSYLIIFLLGVAYVASTWFYFGSAHPCEILVVRQKDHHTDVAEKLHREDLQSWKDMARNALPAKDYDRFVRNIEDYSNSPIREENLQRSVLIGLRQKFREITPAQCAWQAVTWQPPRIPASDTSSQN
jgi:hypothetical protein